ncbi:serine hydrolase domain-containing protein [Winogradskyella alexanderae]|uniref:Beta-lactamase family protein n=1 Tax=Winogradskyella alexanderae TaxID=2877123 RepID=A0ABS7XP18_9FLAO|nr:serine hydrolase domain-containing protein [Winogradskyella alexanderae]MCA0131740.1 beta-lactamase family protein [Winogradskyella alexanderae]
MKFKLTAILFTCIIGLINQSFKQEDGTNETNTPLDSLVVNYLKKYDTPGLSIKVFKEENLYWSHNYGYLDLEKQLPMHSDAVMNTASVSKTITTTAVLQLSEKGLLDLSKDVNSYLDFSVRNPNFPDKPITIFQLLTHTSSIKDNKAYAMSYQCGDPKVELEYWIENYFRPTGAYYRKEENFHTWEPNTDYKYSNVAFGLLGLVVEKVSQQSLESYTKTHITEILGMHRSSWFIKNTGTANRIKPYVMATEEIKQDAMASKLLEKKVGKYYQICNYSFYNYPDGLFKTTLNELSHFMMAIMNGSYRGKRILNEKTIIKMLTTQIEGNNVQGIGWKRIEYEGNVFWGHSGRDPGVRTHLYFHPETQTGIVLFQNNDEGYTIKLVADILTEVVKGSK